MAGEEPHVAFLGLGAMGFAMSTHLVRSGVKVTGFDIYPPTLEKWETACQKIKSEETPNASFSSTTSPAAAVSAPGVNLVILMVATHLHVESALFDPEIGAVKALPRDIPVLIMATIPPTYPSYVRKRLNEEHSRSDIRVIDAPVSGGTVRSANGTLTIMASSESPANIEQPLVKHILHSLSNGGRTFFPIPGGLGSGEAAKALNQVQCGIHIVGGAEIMVLAALAGVNTKHFLDHVGTPTTTSKFSLPAGVEKEKYQYGWTWMLTNRGPRMLDPSLPLSSAIAIINKDVGIIVDEETRLSVALPMIDTAARQLKQCMDAGIAGWDDAFITKFYLDTSLKNESRMNTCIAQAQTTYQPAMSADEQRQTIATVMQAHALINLMSAYETVLFAEALDLMGPTQRKMWFTLIAGAAGGSTVFEEVVPFAFEQVDAKGDWRDGFKEYVRQVVEGRWDVQSVEDLVGKCVKGGQVEFVMVKKALEFVKTLH